jgi:hypothetical protein
LMGAGPRWQEMVVAKRSEANVSAGLIEQRDISISELTSA